MTRKMRKPKIHHVNRGSLTGEGATRTLAKADLERQTDWACRNRTPHIETRFGHLIIVAAIASGIETRVLRPDEIATHGKLYNCSCFSGQSDMDREIRSARLHAAHLAWTPETMDVAHVEASGLDAEGKRELGRWITFQRDYTRHIANGKTPGEAHELAGRYHGQRLEATS
jgi:hypothetical protein